MTAPNVTARATNPNWTRVNIRSPDAKIFELLSAASDMPGLKIYEAEVPGDFYMNVPRSVVGAPAWTALEEHLTPLAGGPVTPRPHTVPRATDVTISRALYPHQQVAVDFLIQNRGGLLADAMGLGKTAAAGVAAAHLRGEGHVLICGPLYTRAVWKQELTELGLLAGEDDFVAMEGREIPEGFWGRAKKARFWFCHYDIVKYWAPRWVSNGAGRITVCVLDEAHWLRNRKSQRATATLESVGIVPQRIALTGTPIANRPRELWALLTIVDGTYSWGSEYDYRTRYCGAFMGSHGLIDGNVTNAEELQGRLERVYLRRTPETAGIQLPELTRTVHTVEPGSFRHTGVSAETLSSVLTALKRGSFGPDTLTQLMRLAKQTSTAKIPTTAAYLAELIEQEEAAVVFVHERQTAEILAAECPIGRAFFVHGGMSQTERDELVAQFQARTGPGVLCATYGALREGVTLHRARHVVLHDLTWVPGDILQAEKRVHRIGQSRATFSRWMALGNSFDALLAAHLAHKAALISASIGDHAAKEALAQSGLNTFAEATFDDDVTAFLRGYEA